MDRCFVAGLAYYLGIRRLGAAAVRNGLASLDSHLEIIRRLSPTVLVGVPTFLRKLGQYMEANGLPPAGTRVRMLVCIGEPVRDERLDFLRLGRDLETIWPAKVYSTYASSETITTFCECTAQRGGHLHPDLGIVEILDDDGRPVPEGATGEVVVTPLGIEGMPLVRFRTGDISFLAAEPCPCGRRSPRLGPILGRKRQMMKVRGTTLYPQAIYSVLDSMPGIGDYYVKVTSEDALSDEIEVHASVRDGSCSAEQIRSKLQARLRVTPAVVIETEDAVRQQVFSPKSRKPVRFIDARES
jgi:phenylacetate-CoA ligase